MAHAIAYLVIYSVVRFSEANGLNAAYSKYGGRVEWTEEGADVKNLEENAV